MLFVAKEAFSWYENWGHIGELLCDKEYDMMRDILFWICNFLPWSKYEASHWQSLYSTAHISYNMYMYVSILKELINCRTKWAKEQPKQGVTVKAKADNPLKTIEVFMLTTTAGIAFYIIPWFNAKRAWKRGKGWVSASIVLNR